jgi:hypothetical protein
VALVGGVSGWGACTDRGVVCSTIAVGLIGTALYVSIYRGSNVPCLSVALESTRGSADSLTAVPSDHVLAAIVPMGAVGIDRLVADLNSLREP